MRYDEPRLVWTSLTITHFWSPPRAGLGHGFSFGNRTQNSRVAGSLARPTRAPNPGSASTNEGLGLGTFATRSEV
jgi:hypothetical protein